MPFSKSITEMVKPPPSEVPTSRTLCFSTEQNSTKNEAEIVTFVKGELHGFLGNKKGKAQTNILLDSCSNSNYATENLVSLLPHKVLGESHINIKTLTGTQQVKAKFVNLQFTLQGKAFDCDVTVLPFIAESPIKCSKITEQLPDEGKSHVLYNHRCEVSTLSIGLLLGCKFFMEFLDKKETVKGFPCLYRINSFMGAYYTGSFPINCDCGQHSTHLPQIHLTHTEKLNDQVQRLLAYEWGFNSNADDTLTAADFDCLKKLQSSTEYLAKDKKYQVRLLFKSDTQPILKNNINLCKQRLLQTEKQLLALPPTEREQTVKLVHDAIDRGVFVPLTAEEEKLALNPDHLGKIFFLPHRFVKREDSSSTPLRHTLDGSACSGNRGPSINDLQHAGISNLPCQRKLILRWRKHKIQFSLDISKFFLSISLHPDDRLYQCILWKDPGSSQPIRAFKTTCVQFGARSSPQVCTYVLTRHVKTYLDDPKSSEEVKAVCRILLDNVYSDNIFSGAETVEEAKRQMEIMDMIMGSAGLKSAKFSTNSAALLASMPAERRLQDDVVDFQVNKHQLASGTDETKILGARYSNKQDKFLMGNMSHLYDKYKDRTHLTKRELCSIVSSVAFDHLGARGAITAGGRMVFQDLVQKQQKQIKLAKDRKLTDPTVKIPVFNWDDPVPREILEGFHVWLREIPELDKISIPRYLNVTAESEYYVFVDAGLRSYSATAFVRTFNPQKNEFEVGFLEALTRLNPLDKTVTGKFSVPRAELNSAILGVILGKIIQDAYSLDASKIHIFSDSKCVLNWYKLGPSRLSQYHLNRVQFLQQSAFSLQYVPSRLNSADCGTRFCTVKQLLKSTFLTGPDFLKTPFTEWPNYEAPACSNTDVDYLEGIKKAKIAEVFLSQKSQLPNTELFFKFLEETRDYQTLIRKVARLVFFTEKIKRRIKNLPSYTHEESFEHASFLWASFVQSCLYADDYTHLVHTGRVTEKSPLKTLNPQIQFWDTITGKRIPLIVSDSRVAQSELFSRFAKQPIILGPHTYTESLITFTHRNHHHAGRNFVYFWLNQKYLVPSAKQLIKKCLHRCKECAPFSARLAKNIEGFLPSERTELQDGQLKTHQGVCVDYCGPFETKANLLSTATQKTRSTNTKKIWIAIFVDLVSRHCVYLPVKSLSAEDFILAIKAYSGLFSTPKTFFVDNQKSFHRANFELNQLFYDENTKYKLHSEAAKLETKFVFGPPYSPTYQSSAEIQVRLCKKTLQACFGKQILSFYELNYQLLSLLSFINNRPLCTLTGSEISLDEMTLSPNAITFGKSLRYFDFNSENVAKSDNVKKAWKHRQETANLFKRAYMKHYIPTLMARKNFPIQKAKEVKIGDLFLVISPPSKTNREDHDSYMLHKQQKWPIGKCVQVFDSHDKQVRQIKLQMNDGLYANTKNKHGKPIVLKRPSTVIRSLNTIYPLPAFSDFCHDGEIEQPPRPVQQTGQASQPPAQAQKQKKSQQPFHMKLRNRQPQLPARTRTASNFMTTMSDKASKFLFTFTTLCAHA